MEANSGQRLESRASHYCGISTLLRSHRWHRHDANSMHLLKRCARMFFQQSRNDDLDEVIYYFLCVTYWIHRWIANFKTTLQKLKRIIASKICTLYQIISTYGVICEKIAHLHSCLFGYSEFITIKSLLTWNHTNDREMDTIVEGMFLTRICNKNNNGFDWPQTSIHTWFKIS